MLFFKSIQSVLTIILMIALGYILKKNKWFDDRFGKSISSLVVKVALPASIFTSVLKHLTKDSLLQLSGSLIYPIGTVILSYIIAYICIKIFKIKPGRRGIFMNAIANANTIFIGLPLKFLAFSIPVPEFIGSALSYVGSIVTPLALIYIGIILSDAGLSSIRFDRDTILALIGRFIISPLIIIVLILIGTNIFSSDLPKLLIQTFVVQAATPMLAVLPILANEYHCDVKYATNLVTTSTVLFVIVVPVLMLITQYI